MKISRLFVGLFILLVAWVIMTVGCDSNSWSGPTTPPNGGDGPTQPPQEGLPDLVIVHTQWSPGLPSYGQPIEFAVSVRNDGNSPANDVLLGLEFWAPGESHNYVWHPIGNLRAGQAITTHVSASPNHSGVNTFKFWIDASESIQESNDGNNVKVVEIPVE